MIISRRRIVMALMASAIFLSILLVAARVTLPDLSRAQPGWLVALLSAHLLMMTTRGLAFRALAPKRKGASFLSWIHLAARHQLVFSIVPGGIGDAGFPYFAKRIAHLDTHDAIRTIAQFRVRDLLFVALLGLGGIALLGLPTRYVMVVFVFAVPALWFSDDITIAILRIGMKLAPTSRLTNFVKDAADHERPTISDRLLRTTLAILIWSASVVAVISAFRVIGAPIGVAEAMLFIAAVNFVGAVSLSIAGLGPSEAGAAAALVAAGKSLQEASSLALVARPLLLVSVICASLLLDVGLSMVQAQSRLMRASTR